MLAFPTEGQHPNTIDHGSDTFDPTDYGDGKPPPKTIRLRRKRSEPFFETPQKTSSDTGKPILDLHHKTNVAKVNKI